MPARKGKREASAVAETKPAKVSKSEDEGSSSATDKSPAKRGRGRPKLPEGSKKETKSPSGRPRGRPKGTTKKSKSPAKKAAGKGRGRGRPKKAADADSSAENESAGADPQSEDEEQDVIDDPEYSPTGFKLDGPELSALKQRKRNSSEKALFSLKSSVHDTNSNTAFGIYVASEMAEMSKENAKQAKQDILDILYKYLDS